MIKRILIVGGGSAGWMTAAFFASKKIYDVSLIESANVPTIGVGESTIPSIVDFLETIGIAEKDLFEQCSAVRKYSIQHNNWNGNGESWYHHFCFNEDEHKEQLGWMKEYICPNKKWRWAYHLDAARLGILIRDRSAIPNGVKHIIDDVIDVKYHSNGIEQVQCLKNNYSADLYIDCTGFKSLLRSPLGVNYRYNNSLINDTAVCGPGRYLLGEEPLPYTQTFSMDYGWRWRVCLQHRTGNGYTFNSKLISVEDAKKEFIAKTPGLDTDKVFVVPIKNGYNPEPWKHNVISLGLSCGFLEPLEATGLFLVHGPIVLLEKLLSDNNGPIKFNKIWCKVYEHIADFLTMHYKTSQLDHTEYWNSFIKERNVSLPTTKQPIFNQYSYRNLANARGLSYS